MNTTDIICSWESTPQLWRAVRKDYDGAPDANCPSGLGKTPQLAIDDLVLQEQWRAELLESRRARRSE